MLQIPQHILDGLRCYLCNGYLSVKPILVRPENQQVCGKCYKTLSNEEKYKCVRQIGLEHLAVLLNFPCRYNVSGCGFTFKFNDKNTHEEECQYRYRTIRSPGTQEDCVISHYLGTFANEINVHSDEIQAVFSYEIKENKYSKDLKNLNYTLDIRSGCDSDLMIKNKCNYNEYKAVRLSLDGSVLLGEQPESVYSNINVIPIQQDDIIYASLQRDLFIDTFCCNCKAKITNDHNYCLLGHPSCNNCKEIMCSKCENIKANETNGFCKNYTKGCMKWILQDEQSNHSINCEYNNVNCPVPACSFSDILYNLKKHLQDNHHDTTHFTSEIAHTFTHKDDTIVLVCFENIFKCVYYYYKSFVEFNITYIGTVDSAKSYVYEITALTNDGPVIKRASCSNWNDVSLEKGISFDKKDLISKTKKLTFDIKLKIIHYRK